MGALQEKEVENPAKKRERSGVPVCVQLNERLECREKEIFSKFVLYDS